MKEAVLLCGKKYLLPEVEDAERSLGLPSPRNGMTLSTYVWSSNNLTFSFLKDTFFIKLFLLPIVL
jgi:hypothetical protein